MQAFSSHDIFQTLYQQIMLLELKPGSTLRENALCEQFGVSRTPVRSVLQELRIAGLIEVTPYKSTRVTQLDFDTISQQIYLRNAVESAVMTDFAAVCTPEQLAQLKTRNDALRRLAAQPHPDPRMFYELDSRLHESWFLATGKDQLWQLRTAIRGSACWTLWPLAILAILWRNMMFCWMPLPAMIPPPSGRSVPAICTAA